MDKNYYLQKIEKNSNKIELFENFNTVLFHELLEKINEAKNCILFEMPIASITLSNHILERVLKLALIYNFTGLKAVDTENFGNHYTDAHLKYNGLNLFSTVEECKKQELITPEHALHIQTRIREQLRNGFSHSDFQIVLQSSPNFVPMYAGHLQNEGENKLLEVNIKTHPGLSSVLSYSFATSNYIQYFTFVFKLMKHIEVVIKRKHNVTEW